MSEIGEDLRQLIARLPLAAAINKLDELQTVVFLNEQFVRTFGYTLEDIPTVRDWGLLAYPDESYRHHVFTAWDAAVREARIKSGKVEAMEFRVVCKDGCVRDVVFGAAVVAGHLLVTLIDVSERRRAEETLRDVQAKLDRTAFALTENIPIGTYTMVQPPAGGMASFEFLSRRFLDICGLTADEARGDPYKAFTIIHPEDYDEWVRKNAEVFAAKVPFSGECRIIVDGTVRHIRAESTPRRLADGSTVWEGVLIDITREVKAESALAAAREQERRQEQLHRSRLEKKLQTSLSAALAAHEIKQPLSRILIETQLAIERLQGNVPDPDHMREYLENMLAESQHVVDMVGRMKAILRNADSKHGVIDLTEVVASAILYSRPSLLQHAVTLQHVGLDRPARIRGDCVQLQTAVINLIRNAVEAVADQDAARREAVVTLCVDTNKAEIIVGDGGPGMPEDVIANLPFVTSKPDGTGLGLYLVRTCMENHGGTMSIGRSPLGGTEVRLTLPLEGDVA